MPERSEDVGVDSHAICSRQALHVSSGSSCSLPVVALQQPAQPFAALDGAVPGRWLLRRINDTIAQPLVRPFRQIMLHVWSASVPLCQGHNIGRLIAADKYLNSNEVRIAIVPDATGARADGVETGGVPP